MSSENKTIKTTNDSCVFGELPLYLEVSDSTFDIHTLGPSYRAVRIVDIFTNGIAIADDSSRRVLIQKSAIVSIEINEAAKKQKIRGDV